MQTKPKICMQKLCIFKRGHLIYKDHNLNLSKRPMMQKLFLYFLREPLQPKNIELLVQEIYNISPYPDVSLRLWTSKRQNLTKLISRSRKLANLSFAEIMDPGWRWFPYDAEQKCWTLFATGEPIAVRGQPSPYSRLA